ncbi:MAG: aminopeptidase [Bacteroidetes bacterium]|nr:aminopeptidase [Bacteroidota bacterium]
MKSFPLFLLAVLPYLGLAQPSVRINEYHFDAVKDLEAQPVQDQSITGTCWSFSTLSFMESEVNRLKDMDVKLSEMWIVRHAYIEKAERYVRFHGNVNFDEGGAFHDVTAMIAKYGIVPQATYPGLGYGSDKHHHAELKSILRGMCEAIVKNPNRTLTTSWREAIVAVVDAYLGAPVKQFEHEGRSYSPKSFAEYVGIKPENYVVLTSFTHQPMYSPFIMELPDNWLHASAYNVPLQVFMEAIDAAVLNGYSLAWAADVSEQGFSHRNGVAVVPEGNFAGLTRDEIDPLLKAPHRQENVTPEMRQVAYDNYQTTDDHGMHIIGKYQESDGTVYYKVKNSWGTKSNECDGYLFVSQAYVAYKTINVMVHKDALSKSTRKELGL